VVTETEVPNEQKALPSQKGPALMLAFGGAAVALVAVILDYYEFDLLALLLAILAALMTVLAVMMALSDVRTGAGAPIMCAIAAGVVLIVGLMDVLDADELLERQQQAIEDNTRQRLDESRDEEAEATDFAQPAAAERDD
jgi:phosphotransferase system  glucose/maltose/N-acetylglucosamine-specific IIC component